MINCCSQKWSLTQWYLIEIFWKVVGIFMNNWYILNVQNKNKNNTSCVLFIYESKWAQTKGMFFKMTVNTLANILK